MIIYIINKILHIMQINHACQAIDDLLLIYVRNKLIEYIPKTLTRIIVFLMKSVSFEISYYFSLYVVYV